MASNVPVVASTHIWIHSPMLFLIELMYQSGSQTYTIWMFSLTLRSAGCVSGNNITRNMTPDRRANVKSSSKLRLDLPERRS